MGTMKFCSGCGRELKAKRRGFRPFRAFCPRCAPSWRRIRHLRVAAFGLLLTGSFVLGRYSYTPEPLYLIGTPVDSQSARAQSAIRQNGVAVTGDGKSIPQNQKQQPDPTDAAETLCGAPTKSGRPCRRKVRGGGYCYQHRDKSKQKTAADGQ